MGSLLFNEGDYISNNPNVIERKDKYIKMKNSHPDKIPCIIEYSKNFPKENRWNKCKFLVHKDNSLANLLHHLRTKMNMKPSDGIIVMINNYMPKLTDTMEQLYNNYSRGENEFLYLVITKENVFG